DVFHSSGEGGHNVNKGESAIRVTHLPTGLTVVCQDERSQLKNKKRALATIAKKLKERSEQAEKKRMEADICAQHSQKNTPISFDTSSNTMSDTRLKAFYQIPFPLDDGQFSQYIDGLIAL
ncbi:MAG: peptide chain release factor 1, partial [Clostridia bacterium]|nr:peptide chain release factor 1 [Clostridia bacterium]